MDALVLAPILLVALFLIGYFVGRKRQKVTCIGKNTYIRFFPNPGVGVSLFGRHLSVSVVGGIEYYVGRKVYSGGVCLGTIWVRKWHKWCRIIGKHEVMKGLGGE